jgi:hypothetical protein
MVDGVFVKEEDDKVVEPPTYKNTATGQTRY